VVRLAPTLCDDISMQRTCIACGAEAGYRLQPVLWPELTEAWELNDFEVRTLDARDAVSCINCQTQLRNMTLARAVMLASGLPEPFTRLRRRRPWLRVLELNQCGSLRRFMRRRRMPWKVSGDYPAVDMESLPYRSASFDLVLHGDTLEHVPDPIQGLRECLRVLKPKGALCYTVPVVVGRPSRRRDGMPPSYHGTRADPRYLVHTEYGDDFWQQPLAAGFGTVGIVTINYPSSFALICRP
jgi:SAM-dependent methyltransferase